MCWYSQVANATLAIQPAYINLTLTQKRVSGVFFIKNVGDTEERYRATAVHFVVGLKGGLQILPPDDYSLSKWIKFNPKEFVLPPKSSRMVRYSVIPQGKIKPREYWGAIEFRPLKGAKIVSKDKDGNSIGLEVLNVVLVPIYGLVAGTQFTGELTQVTAVQDKDAVHLTCTINNTGEGVLRFGGTYQITDPAGKLVKEDKIKLLVVFPKTQRIHEISIKDKLPSGKYKVQVKLQNANTNLELSGAANFDYENK